MPDYADTRDLPAKRLRFEGDAESLIDICAECEGTQTKR